jgi:hypothetical protein
VMGGWLLLWRKGGERERAAVRVEERKRGGGRQPNGGGGTGGAAKIGEEERGSARVRVERGAPIHRIEINGLNLLSSAVAEPPELFQLKCLSHASGAVTHLNRKNPSVPQI